MKYYKIVSFWLISMACNSADDRSTIDLSSKTILSKSVNSDVFNESFHQLLFDYYSLKDHFIDYKDSLVNRAAQTMLISLDSVALKEIPVDHKPFTTVGSVVNGLSSELEGLLGETEKDAKRKSLQMVSDHLYELIKIVKYDREIIYYHYCTTAFYDQGAGWLSRSIADTNPYNPIKMPLCGEIKDTINHSLQH